VSLVTVDSFHISHAIKANLPDWSLKNLCVRPNMTYWLNSPSTPQIPLC
jgi:hypothetical protein